jgi:hypothetical protein
LTAAIALRDYRRAWKAIAAFGILLGVVQAYYAVRRDTSAPQIQVAYGLARYLEAELGSGESAIILTKPVPPELVQQYLDKIARRGGDAGLQHARKVLRSMETTPPDYQRTVVHSRLGKFRLVSLAGNVDADPAEIRIPNCPALAAVWSDFSPSNAVEADFHSSNIPRGTPVHRIASGGLSVTLYRLQLPAACRG